MELSRRDLRRAFRLTAIMGGVFVVLGILAGLTVPFNVQQAATITTLSDDAMLIRRSGQTIPLIADQSVGQRLSPGQGIRLDEGETATLTFALNGGTVDLVGPAEFTLAQSYRRATTRNHFADRANYVLTLEQHSGTARYNFASAVPGIDSVDLSVRLPLSIFSPDQPCWEIVVSPDGSALPRDIPCP